MLTLAPVEIIQISFNSGFDKQFFPEFSSSFGSGDYSFLGPGSKNDSQQDPAPIWSKLRFAPIPVILEEDV